MKRKRSLASRQKENALPSELMASVVRMDNQAKQRAAVIEFVPELRRAMLIVRDPTGSKRDYLNQNKMIPTHPIIFPERNGSVWVKRADENKYKQFI